MTSINLTECDATSDIMLRLIAEAHVGGKLFAVDLAAKYAREAASNAIAAYPGRFMPDREASYWSACQADA